MTTKASASPLQLGCQAWGGHGLQLFLGTAAQVQYRFAQSILYNDDILEKNILANTHAQSLGAGLFGGPALGITR